MEEPKSRPVRRETAGEGGSPGLRAPIKGESSSSNNPESLPSDPPKTPHDPEATMVDYDATMVDGVIPISPPPRRSSALFVSAAVLNLGDVLGGRYEVLQLLGEGGMGAVYKVRDRELDRFVALKLIRPELAASPAILARFKQELLLAHQVTHKNVIRIYDLSEADGVRFITMEYIEGVDLRRLLLDRGKIPPTEAVEIIRPVCFALYAAHTVGVIHRDLKPQNIMQDQQGRILVMDFGLARSIESEGMTQTGALVGTMEYMSPEQAMGGDLDQRSDIFALGLIFFELLTGKMPYKADTALASLLKRNQERAIPAVDLDPAIPKGMSDIVSKCLERDLNQRYQNVQEILNDLDAWQGKRPISASVVTPPPPRPLPWKWIGIAALAVLVAVGGWALRGKITSRTASRAVRGPVTSLAILPFRNASGDPSLDWLGSSMADMLSTDVGQSSQLRTVSSNRLQQIFTDLRISSTTALDPPTIRRVADFSNADRVVWGQYAKFGDQIRIDATLQDIKNDRSVPLKIDIPSEKEIPGAVDRLAESIRQKLALPEDALKELKASSFQPTSNSVDALRDYNQGIGLQRDGKNLEAQKLFEAATKADPTFALAYAKLGQTYASLGYDNEAEQASRKAVDLSSNLRTRERYLIVASYARIVNDNQKAIEYYTDMAKVSPEDTEVQFALGNLYENTSAYDKAREHYNSVLKRDPQYIDALLAMGRVETKGGDANGGLEYLNRAYSLAIQRDNQEQKAASLHAMGLAYEALNKLPDALQNFQDSLAIKRRIGQLRGAAAGLSELGNIQAQLGKPEAAQASFQEALKIRRDIGDKRGAGATLLDFGNFVDDRGDHDQALQLYKESLQIQRDTGNESLQAICLNNIGSTYFSKGEYEDALTYFQQALQLREKSKVPQDIVDSVHNVAETSAMMGRYDQAISQYMRALELHRTMNDARGAAIESYSIGTLFDYQGRFGAAINSKQDALKAFRDLKDRTFWMAEILGGYADALILGGRGDEAKSHLDEALGLSRELKNDGLVAQTLSWQGDALYYRGDAKSARPLYVRALQAATHTTERDKVLIAKVNLAKVDIQEGHSAAAISALRPLVQQASGLGLKQIAVVCSIYMAEAMAQAKDFSHARPELERALIQSDKLGLNPLSLKAHYLLGTVLRQSGHSTEAQDHYRQALRLLDTIRKEPGTEKVMQRSDLDTIFNESNRWLQPAKN